MYLAADHGGFELKEAIKRFLQEKGIEVEDLGTDSAKSVDYPDFGKALSEKIDVKSEPQGVLVCGSGVGMSMIANRVPNVRAVLANSVEVAELARQHNGANVLCLGGRTDFVDGWKEIVETFINTKTDESERHERRRGKLCGC